MEQTGSALVYTRLLLTFAVACSTPFKPANGAGSELAPDTGIAPPTAAGVPCQIADVLKRKCQTCHGTVPGAGAPMSLVSLSDLTAPAHSDPKHRVYELIVQRARDRARPMPPDPSQRLNDAEFSAFQSWAQSGAHAGTPCAGTSEASLVAAPDPADPDSNGMTVSAGNGGAAAGSGGQTTRETPAATLAGSGAAGQAPAPAAGSGGQASATEKGRAGSAAGSGGAIPSGGAPAEPATPPPTDEMPLDPSTTSASEEQCYELRAHGHSGPADPTQYAVPAGETYTSFVFKAPWTQPVQGLRFRHVPDNAAVLHHWILYTESARAADGDIQPCDLSGLLGFLCGQGSTRSMVTGWAPGRGDFQLPDGVGLELPAPGALLALEVHYFNTGPDTALDRSGVEVCVTSQFRPHTASVSWLGTESIRIPANAAGTATGTCTPRRSGLGTNDPIHILYSWPHMHKLGRHMRTVVNRASGSQEVLYDGDFSFEYQVVHETPLLLQAGDTLSTRCDYENTTNNEVRFGQSTTEEMCFDFVYAWPAHALDNPNGGFGEAGNTCLH